MPANPTINGKPYRTYMGDVADYGVIVERENRARGTATVTIVDHDTPDCTIPKGATITVPADRII